MNMDISTIMKTSASRPACALNISELIRAQKSDVIIYLHLDSISLLTAWLHVTGTAVGTRDVPVIKSI